MIWILYFLSVSHYAAVGRPNKMKDFGLNFTELESHIFRTSEHTALHYDVSTLIPVNENGEVISQTETKKDFVEKKEQLFYRLSAHGKTFHLNLTRNKRLLATNFNIETKHRNGSITKSLPAHKNYFYGHVISHPDSKVALCGKEKLRGVISVSDDHIFEIHPLPDRLLRNFETISENTPHLVVKRSITDRSSYIIDLINADHKRFIRKRDLSRVESDSEVDDSKFLEVMYVADHYAAESYGKIELPEILLAIANIVSHLMFDLSSSGRRLVYVVSKILILKDRNLSYKMNTQKLEKLNAITSWAKEHNKPDADYPKYSDQTVLFTIGNSGGMATLGMICKSRDASAMVSLSGLSTAFVLAHETVHNLGYGHDGSQGRKDCPNGAGIMSTFTPSGTVAFVWSKCSREYVNKFLISSDSQCLDDIPSNRGPTKSPILRAKLPGEVFDADKQCEMTFGAGRKQCNSRKHICSSLYCTNTASTCSYILSPPADGTKCGDRHWCIHGKCVDNGSPVIDGSWSAWSDYTPCSVSCGIGIQYRTRKCNHPPPENGGKQCSGTSIGHHKICKIKNCPEGVQSYRKDQCTSAGYSAPYYIAKEVKNPISYLVEECSLWCVRDWKMFYSGVVKDGTPPTNDPTNNDVCIGGKHESVGCDLVLNSEKENDRCGICNGGGNTCSNRSLSITKNTWKFGTSDPLKMAVVKKGCTNILVKTKTATWNWLGVRNMKGEYLIHLPTFSVDVYKAGTKISYIHNGNWFKDEIKIVGPITEDIQLVLVRNFEANPGVSISFMEPDRKSAELTADNFTWKTYEWSSCSLSCGGGSRKRKVKCRRNDDETVAGNKFCDAASKPHEEEPCTNECKPVWFIESWKPCSKKCGGGIQSRKVVCRRKKMDSWIIEDDSVCSEAKPDGIVLKRRCNERMCEPRYIPLGWSKCSTDCDEGVSTRGLKCEIINKKGKREIVSLTVCQRNGSPRPLTSRRCNFHLPCEDKVRKYHFINCYRDSADRLLPEMLGNLRSKIDWHNPSMTIKECAALAAKKGKEYFAIQYYGECRTYKDGQRKVYDQKGISVNYWSGLGGAWTNCVYQFT